MSVFQKAAALDKISFSAQFRFEHTDFRRLCPNREKQASPLSRLRIDDFGVRQAAVSTTTAHVPSSLLKAG